MQDQFARVKMVVKKGEPGCGLEFINKVVGGNIQKNIYLEFKKELKEQCKME